MSVDAAVLNNRYKILDFLGHGGMGAVYRVRDQLTGDVVALKRVTHVNVQQRIIEADPDFPDARFALATEFRTLAGLRHPNIISVLDYGFDTSGYPFYTMDLLETSTNILDYATDKTHQEIAKLSIQMLQALSYLHQRGIVHRDIKPDNVQVTSSGIVKLLDFGLAIQQAQAKYETALVGTISYLAPEILGGKKYTIASDLYAVGVIIYQMLTKKHPVVESTDSINTMLRKILAGKVQISPLDGTPPALFEAILHLLDKNPESRLSQAENVEQAFAREAGVRTNLENPKVREGFLKSAQFVGREEELNCLLDALEHAEAGEGSIYFVCGESGIGKSRLLDEIRIHALIRGLHVIRGEATQESDVPLRIWRHILRHLILYVSIEEHEATFLSLLLPEFQGPRESPPTIFPVNSQVIHERLVTTIVDLLLRLQKPILILLDDLQWEQDSLDILQQLEPWFHQLPLLIIGAFREEDAAQIQWTKPLPIIQLNRLSALEIQRLSTSMIGSVALRQDVQDLLERETEGNIFFIIEVIRVLAEEAGSLAAIGLNTLPANVFARGVHTVLSRRLEHIQIQDQRLLDIAAIAGREIDAALMSYFKDIDELDNWFFVCEQATIFAVHEDRWRFVHDKLREAIIAGMSIARIRAIHGEIATGIEEIYGQHEFNYGRLAYHWRMAEDWGKAYFYAARAAQQALDASAYREALKLLSDCTRADDHNIIDQDLLSSIERIRSYSYYGLHYIHNSIAHAQESLQLIGFPTVPENKWLVRIKLAQQLLLQLIYRIAPKPFMYFRHPKAKTAEACRVLLHSAQARIFINAPEQGILSNLFAMNLSEQLEPSAERAFGYSAMSYALSMVGLKTPANYYKNLSLGLLHSMPNDVSEMHGMALHALGGAMNNLGQIEEALKTSFRAVSVFQQSGTRRYMHEAFANQAFSYELLGHFDQAFELRNQLYESGKYHRENTPQIWALAGLAQVSLWRGQLEEAEAYLTEREDLLSERNERNSGVYWSLLFWKKGNLELAQEYARLGIAEAQRATQTEVHNLYAHYNLVEVCMGLYEKEIPEFENYFHQSLSLLQRFARRYPVARPRLAWAAGWDFWKTGKSKKAYNLWQKSLSDAETLHMPYDQAIAHLALAQRHQSMPEYQKILHQTSAQKILHDLKVSWNPEEVTP